LSVGVSPINAVVVLEAEVDFEVVRLILGRKVLKLGENYLIKKEKLIILNTGLH